MQEFVPTSSVKATRFVSLALSSALPLTHAYFLASVDLHHIASVTLAISQRNIGRGRTWNWLPPRGSTI